MFLTPFPLRAAVAALAIYAGLSLPAYAHDGPHEAPPDAEATASVLNRRVLAAMRNYERAAAKDKPGLLQTMQAILLQRQEHLYALVERNPRQVLLMQLPGELRARLPASAAAAVEQEVDATGVVLGRVGDDFANNRARHHFMLEVQVNGSILRLTINGAGATLSTDELLKLVGSTVTIRGLLLKDHLVVSDRSKVTVLAAGKSGSGSGATGTTTQTTAAAPVDETTLVIMGNFTDKSLTCTGSDIASRLFSTDPAVQSMHRLYAETSRQQIGFSGQVIGPFTIPYSSTGSCDYTGWGSALKAAAQAAGVDPSRYRRVSYAIPSNGSCGWAGLAYLGGSFPTQSWVAACGNTGVFVHEIGHNLRFHHASTPTSEYGDSSDPMGGARMVQFNASNRTAAGWQPAGTVVDVSGTGSHTLTSLSLTSALTPQVLRLRKADTNEYYYVSLRTGTGFDTNLSGYKNLVSVHRSPGTLGSKTYVLAQLGVGQSFTDSANAITITPSTISGEGATVAVTTGTPACTMSAPTLAVSPLSQSGAAGTTRQYSVTVTNRNGSTCASSTFSMGQSLPGGFGGGFSPASATLAPGASASLTWSVTSAAGAADGTYTLGASVADSADAGNTASAGAAYVVFSDSTPPTVTVLSPSNGANLKRGRITLSASAIDADGVSRVEFYANGEFVGSDSSAPYSVNWNARKVAPGNYRITARAFDNAESFGDASVDVQLR